MAGRGNAFLTFSLDSPLPALIAMSLTATPTSRFGFSIMRDKFYYSCFEITSRTALAQFRHFTLKTRVRFQKGGGGSTPQTHSLGAPLISIPVGLSMVNLSPSITHIVQVNAIFADPWMFLQLFL